MTGLGDDEHRSPCGAAVAVAVICGLLLVCVAVVGVSVLLVVRVAAGAIVTLFAAAASGG